MSGEHVWAIFRKPKPDPFHARLEVESDRRLFGCMGSGSVFGSVLVAYALSIQIFPDPGERSVNPRPEPPVWPRHRHDEGIRVQPPANYHGSIRDRRMANAGAHPHPGPGRAGHQPPKPHAVKPVAKDPGVLVAALIHSRGSSEGLGAYALLGEAVRNVDLNKLEQFGSLTRTDKTRISGRIGRQSNEYNEGYVQDGTGDGNGTGNELPGLPRPTGIPGAVKGPAGISDMTVRIGEAQGGTSRSSASILAVIRSHAPGLRHLYNTHLKLRPGLSGKVTLRFAIAPSGEVVDAGLAGSTTSDGDFDAEVMKKVLSWRFEPVKAPGNDIVTVPFNFSE
jgi:TonB family protein